MLLPFEFLFPRGFFAADILVVFPLTCFLKYWTDVNFWRIFDENVLERYSVRTDNWIMASVTERKYFMDWLLFPWIWLLEVTSNITENCFVRIKNFCSGFCFKFISIKGLSSGIYLWNWSELHVGTWTEHLRGFLRGICFCDQGLCERILFG